MKSDYEKLKHQLNIRDICLRNARIATMLLQIGAKKGLNLKEICQALYRAEDEHSQIEKITALAEKHYKSVNNMPFKELYLIKSN